MLSGRTAKLALNSLKILRNSKLPLQPSREMSLVFWDPFRSFGRRPSRIADQHFGVDLRPEDLLTPLVPREFRSLLSPLVYQRPWRSLDSEQDFGSTVHYGDDKFTVNLDVQQFKPEEVTVKIQDDGNTVVVEGKHEEKEDEHGFISRRFVRKYFLPKGHDLTKVESQLSSDGVLTITVPKTDVVEKGREIPIKQTGQPSKAIEDKSGKNEE